MRKAIVMAGGQGSRLWPLTHTRPKPLVRVANRPVMAYLLEWLQAYGVEEVLATLHYRADDIRREFGDGRALGLNLTYRVEEQPLGTAGAVKRAEDWVAGEPFFIVSGDALTDLNLETLRRRHQESGAWLTLGLKHVADPSAYGVVALDVRGRVVRFQEKPGPGQAFSALANCGIYCAEPQVLERVPRGRAWDWSRDVFPTLLAAGLPLFGHVLDGYWCDIGSMDDYRWGQWAAMSGSVRAALPAAAAGAEVWLGPNVAVAPDAVLQGPLLVGAACRIEQGAVLLPGSVIGDRSVVGAGACVAGAVVGKDCHIRRGAVVRDCVLDDEVRVGAACSVCEGAVIGRGCRLAAGVRVSDSRRVGPDQWLCEPSVRTRGETRRRSLTAAFSIHPSEHPAGSGGMEMGDRQDVTG